MPPFELQTLDGTHVRSANLKGKVLLLNFWATWCGPCKDEMPSLGKLSQRFKQEDFLVLTITTDIQPKTIQSFLEILNVDFPVLLDTTQEVSHAYMARALPLTVLVDKDGQLIGKAMGPREWNSPASIALISQLLDKPVQ
ncbi:MAG: TlpA family protein disulfide reductase [Nitrospirales bacterium]